MEHTIKSGAGGNTANVDDNHRLHVQALSEDESLHSAELGSAFNLNTKNVSYNADGTLAYLKNTDPNGRDLVIESIIVFIGDGFTHTDFPHMTLIDTPTEGDLISDANVTGVINRNRHNGKSGELQGLFYKGKVAGTQSGGDESAFFALNKTGRSAFPINWIIGQGKSFALTLDLSISAGSANIYTALVCYYKDLQSRD